MLSYLIQSPKDIGLVGLRDYSKNCSKPNESVFASVVLLLSPDPRARSSCNCCSFVTVLLTAWSVFSRPAKELETVGSASARFVRSLTYDFRINTAAARSTNQGNKTIYSRPIRMRIEVEFVWHYFFQFYRELESERDSAEFYWQTVY
jgi:hypothetical protein